MINEETEASLELASVLKRMVNLPVTTAFNDAVELATTELTVRIKEGSSATSRKLATLDEAVKLLAADLDDLAAAHRGLDTKLEGNARSHKEAWQTSLEATRAVSASVDDLREERKRDKAAQLERATYISTRIEAANEALLARIDQGTSANAAMSDGQRAQLENLHVAIERLSTRADRIAASQAVIRRMLVAVLAVTSISLAWPLAALIPGLR